MINMAWISMHSMNRLYLDSVSEESYQFIVIVISFYSEETKLSMDALDLNSLFMNHRSL